MANSDWEICCVSYLDLNISSSNINSSKNESPCRETTRLKMSILFNISLKIWSLFWSWFLKKHSLTKIERKSFDWNEDRSEYLSIRFLIAWSD